METKNGYSDTELIFAHGYDDNENPHLYVMTIIDGKPTTKQFVWAARQQAEEFWDKFIRKIAWERSDGSESDLNAFIDVVSEFQFK